MNGQWVWLWPQAFWLLPLVVIGWWFARFRAQTLPTVQLRHAFIDRWLTKTALSGSSAAQRHWWGLTAVWLVLALAQPAWQTPGKIQTQPLTQVSGMLVVETSVSLLLQEADGKTRLQQLQGFVSQLTALRHDQARTGLVVFADEVYPVLSPTQDRHQMSSMVSRLDAAFAGREDAALLEAVQFAGWQLVEQSAVNPWLLLITDGAHTATRGQLDAIMAWLTRHSIRVSVLLLGSDEAIESSASGLLYMPRQAALAEALSDYGAQVVKVEDAAAVSQLLAQLTQTVASEATETDTTAEDSQALSSVFLLLALLSALLMWWREMRDAVV